MLTVINPDGTYSGVQYATDEARFREHHAQYGQTCIWIERVLSQKADGSFGSPTQDDLDINTLYETEKALLDLDMKSIRALRAIVSGTYNTDDVQKLSELETQAQTLRTTRQQVTEKKQIG